MVSFKQKLIQGNKLSLQDNIIHYIMTHVFPILGSFISLSKSINPLEFRNKAAYVSGLVQDASPRILLEPLKPFAAGWAKNHLSTPNGKWKEES